MMLKQSRLTVFALMLTVVFYFCAMWIGRIQAQASSLEVLGHRLVRDGDYRGAHEHYHAFYLESLSRGARLQFYLKNNSSNPITIDDYSINGQNHASLPSSPIGNLISESKWWMAWPNPVPAGKLTALRIRITDTNLLNGNDQLTIHTSEGDLNYNFSAEPSQIWMPFIHFSADLTTLTIYAANQSAQTFNLDANGGVRINNEVVSVSAPTTTLAPDDMVPLTVHLGQPLPQGELVLVELQPQSGLPAWGSLRALPSRFDVTFWNQRPEANPIHLENHNIDLSVPGMVVAIDEPMGNRISPLAFRDQVVNQIISKPNEPAVVQLSGYEENLVYADIADISMSHKWSLDAELTMFLTWPKPIWYLPQDAWARRETLTTNDEYWYPLEHLIRDAYGGIAYGGKNIQWFTYFNLWEQGYGRWADLDATRHFQDLYQPAALANPVIMDRVGRVSATLRTARSFIANSAPYHHEKNLEGIEVHTVLSGTNKALVVLIDHRTPESFYSRTSGSQNQQILYNYTFAAKVPSYLAADRAYLIDPFRGVVPLEMSRLSSMTVELTIPSLNSAALIVLGSNSDQNQLESAWTQAASYFGNYADNAVFEALAKNQLIGVGSDPWRAPETNFRVEFEVTNTGSMNSTFTLPIKTLPTDRLLDTASVRVFDIAADQQVPFYLPPPAEYDDFSGIVLSRMGNSRAENNWTETVEDGELTFTFQPAGTSEYWTRFEIINPNKWPSAWIPATYRHLVIEAKVDSFRWLSRLTLYIDYDTDNNGDSNEEGFIHLNDAEIVEDLGDGWKRYYLNVEQAFGSSNFQGQWKFWIQSVIQSSNWVEPTSWSIRSVDLAASNHLTIQLPKPIDTNESRSFELYYDLQANGPFQESVYVNPNLSSSASSDVLVISRSPKMAFFQVDFAGQALNLTAHSFLDTVEVQHLKSNGQIISSHILTSDNRLFGVVLPQLVADTDLIQVTPVHKSGEGSVYLIDAQGRVATGVGGSTSANVRTLWTKTVPGRLGSADINSAGDRIVIGVSNSVQLLDGSGNSVWEKRYQGKVFFVKFSHDHQSIYAAANLGMASDQFHGVSYEDVHVIKYDLAGNEKWRYKTGRTVFNIDPDYPDNSVLVGTWENGNAIKLTSSGQVLWQVDNLNYPISIAALETGGGLSVGNIKLKKTSSSGENEVVINRPGFAIITGGDADAKGNILALASDQIHLYRGDGVKIGVYPIDSYVKTLKVSDSGEYIAVGTTHGNFVLLNSIGQELWNTLKLGTMVTDAYFLPQNQGVVLTRELFHYDNLSMWRYQTIVEAYDIEGNKLWEFYGDEHELPNSTILARPDDATRTLVASGDALYLLQFDTTVALSGSDEANGGLIH